MPRTPAESRATTAGKWLLAFVVPASAQALGSVPTEALMVMSVVGAVACGLLWFDADVRTSRASQLILAALGVLLGMTILQAAPLPAGVCRFLAPTNADIWERALSPLHEAGPTWHTLSVAPLATRVEVLRGFFYGCVFLGALRVATLDHGETFLTRIVVFSTALMAFSALAHTATGAEKIFGFYKPRELHAYRPEHFAPLLNTNHLAAYLNMGTCVALGALLAKRSIPRAISGSAMVVLAGLSIWQGSRGATGTLILGVVLTIGLTLYARRRFESVRVGAGIFVGCVIVATAIVAVTFSEVAQVHLLSHDLTKVDVAKSSLRLIFASPWFGSGRGGFESVFSSVREGHTYVTFTHAEDFAVQWLVEWGIPVSVAGAALLGWALRPQILLHAVRPAVGVWVALIIGILQELVDYHFETPGVVALAAVCVAVVVSGRAKSNQSRAAAPSSRRMAALAVATGTLVATVFVWPALEHALQEERRALSILSVDKSVSREKFRDAARAAMLRYPAEPFLPLMGAVRAQVVDAESVIPWVARALERNPRFGRAHFVLARSLAVGHAAQARLEYRLAYENDERLRYDVVKEAVPLISDATTALELVPDGPAGVDLIEVLIAALANRLPSTAILLDAEIERRAPGSIAPFRRRAQAAASDAIDKAPWCEASPDCMVDAVAAAEDLARREPGKCAAHLLVARLRVATGEVARGLDGLERAAGNVTDRADCQKQLIMLALESAQPRRAELTLDGLVRNGCGTAAECIDLYNWAASMEEKRGHYVRAARLYRLAFDLQPERNDLLEHIGSLGNQPGVLPDALDAYGMLALRQPSDPRWPARTAELRSRVRPSIDTTPAGSVRVPR